MAYRQDPDLEFLGQCSSKELDDLVYLLTHDKDGETRWTESLTSNERYKRYYPNHTQYWMEIAEEIQCFGGNTVFNIFRLGKGVLYKEILGDVCDKMKVNYNKSASTEHIEDCLLMKILEQSLEKMSAEEIRELGSSLGVSNVRTLSGPILTAAFLNLFKAGGFASYKASLIIVNAVSKALIGKGLSFAANRGLAKTMSILAGPVGGQLLEYGQC